MKALVVAAVAVVAMLAWAAPPAFAHRLDEYLQDATLALHRDRVELQLRLTPGVAVLPAVLAAIDADADGKLSQAEQQAYASQVIGDLTLTIDGHPVPLRPITSTFPTIEEMKDGLGVIVLDLDAPIPPAAGLTRTLKLENHHQNQVAAYLMNCLKPTDAAIRITAQRRSYDQSTYELDYTQAAPAVTSAAAPPAARWSTLSVWLTADAVALACLTTLWLWRRRRRRRQRVPSH